MDHISIGRKLRCLGSITIIQKSSFHYRLTLKICKCWFNVIIYTARSKIGSALDMSSLNGFVEGIFDDLCFVLLVNHMCIRLSDFRYNDVYTCCRKMAVLRCFPDRPVKNTREEPQTQSKGNMRLFCAPREKISVSEARVRVSTHTSRQTAVWINHKGIFWA